MCLGVTNACSSPLYSLIFAGIGIGFLQPFLYFWVLKKIANLDRQTQIVVAAQYGSISIVTFVTAMTFLQQQATAYGTFMPAVAGIMELPALFSGMLLIKGLHPRGESLLHACAMIIKEILLSKKISFIFIGFFVGFLLRNYQECTVTTAILWPFTALLVLFMIDIGIKIAQQRAYIHEFTWSLIAFGLYVPIISGLASLGVCYALHATVGTATLFAVLIASASYIAVPAVMHTQAPQAKEVIYLPLSLAITLPFNVLGGIPLFYYVAQYLLVA